MIGKLLNEERKGSIFASPDKCPSCDGTEIEGDFLSGEIFCKKCGLVL